MGELSSRRQSTKVQELFDLVNLLFILVGLSYETLGKFGFSPSPDI
jgi:hypothetical protein